MILRIKDQSSLDIAYINESSISRVQKMESLYIKTIEEDFNKLNIGSVWTHNVAKFNEYELCENKKSEIGIQLLHYARIFASAFYTLGYNIDKEVQVRFGNAPIILKGRQYKSYMGILDWFKALGLFFVLRDRAGIDLLMSAPRSAFENAAIQHTELDFRILRVVQNIYNQSAAKDMMQYIQEALEATDPKLNMYDVDKESTDFVLHIEEPLLRVWMAALMNKEAYFNEQLEDALLLHKKYYSNSDRCNDSQGWVSWRLLAPVVFAHDSGIKITVESEYIPKWLVEGDFKGIEQWIKWEV